MNKLNINFNKLQKNPEDHNVKDLVNVETTLELQEILMDFFNDNKDSKTLKTTEESLKSLRKLNVVTEKIYKKLKSIQKNRKRH